MNWDLLRFSLAKRLFHLVYPRYEFTEWGNDWSKSFHGEDFGLELFGALDRPFVLAQLLKLVEDLPGDMVECGAYKGQSARIMLQNSSSETALYVFDSFEGLAEPEGPERLWWRRGDLKATMEQFLASVGEYESRVSVYRGWIPDTFSEGDWEDIPIRFVHVDLDLSAPTLESIEFFYPKMVPGGIMLFDDYGFRQCAEVTRVVDSFFLSDQLVGLPTGQAFVMKGGR